MIGSLILAGQLIPKLNFPLQIDYIHATRYNGNTRGGKLNWLKKPNKSLTDKTILLIDDILDEGITLSEIIKYCYSQGAKKVLSAVLVKKNLENKKPAENVDYFGIESSFEESSLRCILIVTLPQAGVVSSDTDDAT